MSEQLLWIILAVLFLGPVAAGLAYALLRRLLGGATWLEWLALAGLGLASYRWWYG